MELLNPLLATLVEHGGVAFAAVDTHVLTLIHLRSEVSSRLEGLPVVGNRHVFEPAVARANQRVFPRTIILQLDRRGFLTRASQTHTGVMRRMMNLQVVSLAPGVGLVADLRQVDEGTELDAVLLVEEGRGTSLHLLFACVTSPHRAYRRERSGNRPEGGADTAASDRTPTSASSCLWSGGATAPIRSAAFGDSGLRNASASARKGDRATGILSPGRWTPFGRTSGREAAS